jgi:hypothetical protein
VATITERQPGVYLARVFLPPMAAGEKGRQVGKVFLGGKKAVRAGVAKWEASARGTARGTVGATYPPPNWRPLPQKGKPSVGSSTRMKCRIGCAAVSCPGFVEVLGCAAAPAVSQQRHR